MNQPIILLGESSFMSFSGIRENIVRIPEVSDVLSEAQDHWDELRGLRPLVLRNCFYRPDEFFYTHPEFQNFLNDLVQYALVRRLENQGTSFQYVLANINKTRSHLLCLKINSLKEFVLKHPAVRLMNTEVNRVINLRSVHLESKYSFYQIKDCGIKTLQTTNELRNLLQSHELKKPENPILNMGLGLNLAFAKSLDQESLRNRDAIPSDKKLDWFMPEAFSQSALDI